MNDDKEWDDFPRKYTRSLIVLPWVFWILIVVTVIYATQAYSKPLYFMEQDGARIVLTDEECLLKEVTNLKRRATWFEKGKTYEGCYGIHEQAQTVIAYFDDGSVVIMPSLAFRPVRAI